MNLPKFRRDDASRFGKKRGVVKREVWNPKGQQKLSFAQVVAGDAVLDVCDGADAGCSGKSACGSQEEGYDFQFPVDKESSSWLEVENISGHVERSGMDWWVGLPCWNEVGGFGGLG